MRRSEWRTINGSRWFVDSFDSVDEFFTALNLPTEQEKCEGSKGMIKDYILTDNSSNTEFMGMNKADIQKYKFGYPEGLEVLRMLPELNIRRGGVKFAYRWDDQDGDDMSMERYYEGMACMRKRYKTSGDSQQGRFVEVKVKLNESGFVDYKAMLWKTYTACRIIDQLEDQGVRVKVTVCLRSSMMDSGHSKLALDITIKNYNAPLNMSLISTVCSPWFFRHWGFLYYAKHFRLIEYLGTASPIRFAESRLPEDQENLKRKDVIMIDSGSCLSQYAADEFIKALEI